MANLVGKSLGKYHIVERLGHGGMAEVYKAYHTKLDRYVTVKVLHSYLVEGQDFLARFDREARAVASLRHPHIVQIHDYEAEDDNYYMVVEFIDGGSLQLRLDELARAGAYMPIRQVLSVLRQVADALDYAHQQGIIHRDIKPSNILLDSKGGAFLSDFGIARLVGSAQFTAAGSMVGTPAYMSPEQALGEDLTDASDIYALGIVAYELLAGKVPFAGDTPLAIVHKQVNEPPLPPKMLRPDLPEQVNRIISRALAKKPADRYQTAMDLYHALEESLPQEVMVRLDAGAAPGSVPLPAAPTIRMEEKEISTPQGVEKPAPVSAAQPLPASSEPVASPPVPAPIRREQTAAPEPPAASVESRQARHPGVRQLPLRIIALALAGIIVAAGAAVLILSRESPPASSLPIVAQTPAVSPTPYAWMRGPIGSTSTPAPQLPYTVDFEEGIPTAWEVQSGWKLASDGANQALFGQGHYWAFSNRNTADDFRLTLRLKLLRGRVHLVTNYNDIGRYFIGFEADHSDLNKQLWPSELHERIASGRGYNNVGIWHDIEIVYQGSTLTFLVDGKQQWTYTDPKPLARGTFAFETQAGAQAYVDDIVLDSAAGAH